MSITSHKIAIYTTIFLFYAFPLYCADHGGSTPIEVIPQKVEYYNETYKKENYKYGIYYTLNVPWESTIIHKVQPDYFFNTFAVHDFKEFRENEPFMNLLKLKHHQDAIKLDQNELQLLCLSPSKNLERPERFPHPKKMLELLKSSEIKIANYNCNDNEVKHLFPHIQWWLLQIIKNQDRIKTIPNLTLENNRSFDGTLDLTEFTKDRTPKLTGLTIDFYIKQILLSFDTSIEAVKFSCRDSDNTQTPLCIIKDATGNEIISKKIEPNKWTNLKPKPQPIPVAVVLQKSKPKFNLMNWFAHHKNAVIISFITGVGTGAGLYYLWHNAKHFSH